MLRGVSFELQRYVCEEDRESTPPTVFWIKPMSGHEANRSASLYMAARKEGRAGRVEMQPGKLDTADRTTFLMVVKRVENYRFGPEFFPDLHQQGTMKEITDEETIEKVARDLPPAYLTEILEQANKIGSVTDEEKKDSGS